MARAQSGLGELVTADGGQSRRSMLKRSLVLAAGAVGIGAARARRAGWRCRCRSAATRRAAPARPALADRNAGPQARRGTPARRPCRDLAASCSTARAARCSGGSTARGSRCNPPPEVARADAGVEVHTFVFPKGTIVGMGTSVHGEAAFAIVGGTGIYAGAQGSYVAKQRLREQGGNGTAEFTHDPSGIEERRMAFDAFLKIDGIPGESTDKTHPGEIEIESYSWGLSNQRPAARGGGGGAGKASFQDMSFSSLASAAGPNPCSHVPRQTLRERAAHRPQERRSRPRVPQDQAAGRFGVELPADGDANGHDERPSESFSLNFVKIDVLYTAQNGATPMRSSIPAHDRAGEAGGAACPARPLGDELQAGAVALGLVERHVGEPEERLRVARVIGARRDAEARATSVSCSFTRARPRARRRRTPPRAGARTRRRRSETPRRPAERASSVRAKTCSASSPAAWPRRSFNALKSSRSQTTSAERRP